MFALDVWSFAGDNGGMCFRRLPVSGVGASGRLDGRTLSLAVFLPVLALSLVMPSSFVVQGPGVVLEVTGADQGEEMIEVSGVRTFPSESSFYMTTVSSLGNASSGTSAGVAAWALANPNWQALPVRALYPKEMTREAQLEHAERQMESSQSEAEILALERAGEQVSMRLTVQSVLEGSPAQGKLAEGDVLVSLASGGETVEASSYSRFTGLLDRTEPGTAVEVAFERDGQPASARIVTAAREEEGGVELPGSRLRIGVGIDDVRSDASVGFALEDVGGSSAGMMFALGIYDALTEGSLAGDARVAGTGTISLSGAVGRIGGIRHKMRGAAGRGIGVFLAPVGNCDEVVGAVPEGMEVFAVADFDEAVRAVEAIGGGATRGLRTCEAALGELAD